MYKTDDELLSNEYFRLKETLEALQAADSVKAIEIEQLKAGNKSLQEPLTNKLQYTATKPKRNSKSPRHESKPACWKIREYKNKEEKHAKLRKWQIMIKLWFLFWQQWGFHFAFSILQQHKIYMHSVGGGGPNMLDTLK